MGKKDDGKSKWIFIAGLVAFAGMAVFLLLSGDGKKETPGQSGADLTYSDNKAGVRNDVAKMPSVPQVPGGSVMEETRPVLSDALFVGRAAKTYRFAAQIPGAIDGLYCYCKCKENPMFRHKTLLTCFTNNHAAECDICMHEAEMAWDMTKDGKTPKEIRTAVDDYYAKHPIL